MSEVPTKRLNLEDTRYLSPPLVGEPLYQCAKAVVVTGFVVGATLDVQVNGATVLSGVPGGFPQPSGALLALPTPLIAGDVVRARQQANGVTSGWSPVVTVRDHTQDYPDGPPRPQIDPAPVYQCGSRTGVNNLLTGCDVWITADTVEVGKVKGAAPHQGVNVTPDYGLGQVVRAWAQLCRDRSPPSVAYTTVPPPTPLPAPSIDPAYEGTQQIRITQLVNGARFELSLNGVSLGIWRTWGVAHLVGLPAPLLAGDMLSVVQRMCPRDPPSPPGDGTVLPCSALPAPQVAPIQCGDTSVRVTWVASGATVKVYRNHVKAGEGGGPVVLLNHAVEHDDVIHVVQTLGTCVSAFAQELTCLCVSPHVTYDPSGLDLFPVGFADYDGGTTSIGGQTLHIRGNVYYPAEDDGANTPFNKRRRKGGPVPIIFMAHGNHSPADPSYLGYDYFQHALAKMGFVAVSVDCNELNGWTSGPGNITDRADIINATIAHFQTLNSGGPIFKGALDFSHVGLMGHSRGGEAVVIVPIRASLPAGVTVLAVLSLAPTDWGATSGPPRDYEFLTLLPAADGDVWSNDGAKYYDRCVPPSFKSQLYVHNACHNFFNRQWLSNDNGGFLPTMARHDHERVLVTYGCAFFRRVLAGHGTVGFLVGTELPPATPTSLVHLAFKWTKAKTVDDHEQANTIAKNSLNEPTSQTGLTADEYGMSQTAPNPYNGSFYGDSVGMVAVPGRRAGTFRSQLKPKTKVAGREVWVRVADVFDGSFPTVPTGFQLGLELLDGSVRWVDSDEVGGVSLPFDYGSQTKSMLSTLRFPVRCFGLSRRESAVRAIRLRLNRKEARALAFDDLQIV
ncbi:hypothetical protein [Pyxidicoccus caerfyrddinensis]|uniref:hypothetical protein n=1 Tax=Pyxidicoccus caerfyrddinensis TaxID=2709663 RepID=UPI0013D9E91B|nr:hypothetical protein [Pyxidicoccus caerfyrddinensis]